MTDSLKLARTSCKAARTRQVSALDCMADTPSQISEFDDPAWILTPQYAVQDALPTPKYRLSKPQRSMRSPRKARAHSRTHALVQSDNSLESSDFLPLFSSLYSNSASALQRGMPFLCNMPQDYMPCCSVSACPSQALYINSETPKQSNLLVVNALLGAVLSKAQDNAARNNKSEQPNKAPDAHSLEASPSVEAKDGLDMQETALDSKASVATLESSGAVVDEWLDPSLILQPQVSKTLLNSEASISSERGDMSSVSGESGASLGDKTLQATPEPKLETSPSPLFEINTALEPTAQEILLGDLFAGVHEQVFKNCPQEPLLQPCPQDQAPKNTSAKPKTKRQTKVVGSVLGKSMPLLHDIELATLKNVNSIPYVDGDEFVNALHILKPQSQSEYAKMMAEKTAQARLLAEQEAAAAKEEEVYDPLQYCQMLLDDEEGPSRRLTCA